MAGSWPWPAPSHSPGPHGSGLAPGGTGAVWAPRHAGLWCQIWWLLRHGVTGKSVGGPSFWKGLPHLPATHVGSARARRRDVGLPSFRRWRSRPARASLAGLAAPCLGRADSGDSGTLVGESDKYRGRPTGLPRSVFAGFSSRGGLGGAGGAVWRPGGEAFRLPLARRDPAPVLHGAPPARGLYHTDERMSRGGGVPRAGRPRPALPAGGGRGWGAARRAAGLGAGRGWAASSD